MTNNLHKMDKTKIKSIRMCCEYDIKKWIIVIYKAVKSTYKYTMSVP